MELPFIETKIDKYTFIREFSNDVDEMDLVWHEDPENRVIEVIEGNGWKFQYDDQLPFEMIDGVEFTIIKGQIHRVIKGYGPLKIKLQKNIL